MDFTEFFNTPLQDGEESQFQNWVKTESAKQKKSLINDLNDYDLRGFWKYSQTYGSDNHAPDLYKKPNHPTFSDQSIYHNTLGYQGGSWAENENGQTSFHPSDDNIIFHGKDGLQKYFKRIEPDVQLKFKE